MQANTDWETETKKASFVTLFGERQDLYLLILGVGIGIAVLAFQYARNQLTVNPLAAVFLLSIGFAAFFTLRRRSDPIGFRLAFIASVFLILAYLTWPTRPDWPTYYDQSYYLAMTRQLSQGYLTPQAFRYGLGYPVLAVPFYYLIGQDALFLPNLVAFIGSIYFFYLFFCSITNELVAKVSILFLMFATTLPFHHVIWWSHGIVILGFAVLSYLTTRPVTNSKLLLAGAITGYAFFTRYTDAALYVPLLVYIIWKGKKRWGPVLMVIGAIPFIALTFGAQWLVFGDALYSPYRTEFGTVLNYFQLNELPYHFFLTFLYFPEDLAIGMAGGVKMTVLIGAFYLIFAPMGCVLLYRASEKKGLILTMITSAVLIVLYSSSYYQFHSGTFGPFPNDFRYILLGYPYMVVFSVIGLFSFLRVSQTETKKKDDH
jgi:hypothetical protein